MVIKAIRMMNPQINVPGILKLHYSPQQVNDMLFKLYKATFHHRHSKKLYRTIIIVILSYFGMFRLSDMNRLLCRNVKIQETCMVIVSNNRKNDPYGVFPMTSVVARKDPLQKLCPVILFEYAMNALNKDLNHPSDYIFSHFYDQSNREKRKLMDNTLYNDLKEAMCIIGMEGAYAHVGPRELRRSAVTQLIQNGVDPSIIQKLGAWKQLSSVHSYITASLADRLYYAKML